MQRIEDVALLRSAQFAEDAGTLAHPVRPESFVEINNFYTMTIYEKGAEIVRMLANLLGKEKFRQGTDEYFRRYDGMAVTVEDFLSALSVADERVSLFMPWYRQPGTPVLSGSSRIDGDTVVVSLAQATRHVPNYDAPIALPIPVDTAIFDSVTGEMLVSQMLLLTKDQDEFVFDGIKLSDGAHPVVSVLRNFSAPVKLDFNYTDEDLARLVAFETEGFNQWQALQTLVNRWLFGDSDDAAILTDALKTAVTKLKDTDPMLAARLFDLPSEKELAMAYDTDYDPVMVKARRDKLKALIAQALSDVVSDWYASLGNEAYADTPDARGRRLLKNVLLDLSLTAGVDGADALAYEQYNNASCMSERLGALTAIIHHNLEQKQAFIDDFYSRFSDEDLVIDTWFAAQTSSSHTGIDEIAGLMARDDFDWNTPNRVRAVLSTLAAKPVQLWSEAGVALYLSAVERLDGSNPLLAARLLTALARWQTLSSEPKAVIQQKLESLQTKAKSKNVLEFLGNMLNG